MDAEQLDSLVAVTELAQNVTVVSLLLFALLGGMKRLYVWRWAHEEMRRQYEERLDEARQREAKKDAEIEWWQRLTLRMTDVADTATRELSGPGGRQ